MLSFVAACAMLGGCRSGGSATGGGVLRAGEVGMLKLQGPSARARVDNRGPSTVQVRQRGLDGATKAERALGAGESFVGSMDGGGDVRLDVSTGEARIEYWVENVTGFSLELPVRSR